MDAIVARNDSTRTQPLISKHAIAALVCIVLSGCEGKSLVDDNPVFAEAPPRRSYTNRATVAANDDDQIASVIQAVSSTEAVGLELAGNSIVATVNGTPIFLDDLIGSLRLSVEADKRITPEQRQKIFYAQVKGRLPAYVEQEIVLHHLKQAIPEDRQAEVDKTLETPFQDVISKIKKDRKVETDRELDALLVGEGLSIDLLRESFLRIQKVQGYLQTLSPPPKTIDRVEMVEFYKAHKEEFTTTERVRWQEIVVLFSQHGGRDGADEHLAKIIKSLEQNADFGETAAKFSDALSAERRGDMGWLEVGGLADKELESQLFAMKSGDVTEVFTRNERHELYRVVDHQQARTAPFSEVQAKIEKKLKQQAAKEARDKVLADLRENAVVITMFDEKKDTVKDVKAKEASFDGYVPINR